MNDDLDDIKAMMAAATPRPDPARRAEDIALAQKNFANLQGSSTDARHTSANRPKGLWTGVSKMLTNMTSRGAMTATTALVACGFLVLTPLGQDMLRSPLTSVPEVEIGGAAIDETAKISDAIATQTAPAVPPPAEESFTLEMSEAQPRVMMDRALDADIATLPQAISPIEPLPTVQNDPAVSATATQAAPETRGMIAAPTAQLIAPVPVPDARFVRPPAQTEAFANGEANPLQITAQTPVSTFSIDVDTAAYSVVRSSLQRGALPPAQAVRVEEMVNYFPYDYAAPDADGPPFRPTVTTFQTPWNTDTMLVHIALQGQLPQIADRPPLNLVFLIDTSGSMDDPTKLPLLKQSFRLMLNELGPQDQVAIVAYAGIAGQVLAPTAATERQTILEAINSLGAGGGTNGQGGLEQAYAIAETMAAEDEVSRVILATDGDFNVGLNDPTALADFIAEKRETGTFLSVLGFGRGNLDDATMQALAQNGNGTAAYIDTLSEAQKVLVDQLSGALFTIASDVKVQVEFNPAQIAEYRLIGYETRALNREDFNNDKVDAGDLGAGHSVTAIYEVTPVGSPAQRSDPLRYGGTNTLVSTDELGYLKLRYKAQGAADSVLIETPILDGSNAGTEARFAAAIAGFGQLLRDGQYLGDWGYDDAIALANANRGTDEFGYRTEAVQLMRLAQSLSQ